MTTAISALMLISLISVFQAGTASALDGAVRDRTTAITAAADRLVEEQNLDGGFRMWISEEPPSYLRTHNIGVTAIGILKAHELLGNAEYETALAKTYKFVVDHEPVYIQHPTKPTQWKESGVDSWPDIHFLINLAEAAESDSSLLAAIQSEVSGTTVSDIVALAKERWNGRQVHYGRVYPNVDGTATTMAEHIVNTRPGSLVPWDLEPAVKSALALHEKYPEDGYLVQAQDITKVIYDCLYGDTPTLNITNTEEQFYTLGLAGAIEAFTEAELYSEEASELKDLLIAYQNEVGFWDESELGDQESVQATAYSIMALIAQGDDDARTAAVKGSNWLVNTQNTLGGWKAVHPDSLEDDECLEADGEAAWALATAEAPVTIGEDGYYSIQSAIDSASSDDTIIVGPGIYEEEIKIMDKSLTLLGAQADVPIVDGERSGDESVIRGKVDWRERPSTFCLVRIQNSNVVINGFTIERAKQWTIAITGSSIRHEGISDILISYNYILGIAYGKDGIFRDSAAADVTITHNYIASNSRGIATNGGGTTITNNTFHGNGHGIAFHGGDPYSVYFPDYAESKYPTIISNNTFENDSTSVYLRLDRCHQSITITGNDITEARNDAIRTWNVYDEGQVVFGEATVLVNPAIHYNNIVGSTNFGINNQVTEINLDATHNWWGHPSGPRRDRGNPNCKAGRGDRVSENVRYHPWLSKPFQTVLEKHVGHYGFKGRHLGKGWNTLSVPIYLDNNAWGDIAACLDENIAYRFNASTQAWELMTTDNKLDPLDAIYIKMNSEDIAPLAVSASITNPPVKELKRGWNLVGLAVWEEENMSVDRALVSVELTPDGKRGYTIVVSPSLNQEHWIYTIVGQTEKPLMNKNEAYWVYMENPGNLAGFSSTPLPFWEPE